jgi:hypothetical protein
MKLGRAELDKEDARKEIEFLVFYVLTPSSFIINKSLQRNELGKQKTTNDETLTKDDLLSEVTRLEGVVASLTSELEAVKKTSEKGISLFLLSYSIFFLTEFN